MKAGLLMILALGALGPRAQAERAVVEVAELSRAQHWLAEFEATGVGERPDASLAPALFELLVSGSVSAGSSQILRDTLASMPRASVHQIAEQLVEKPVAAVLERAEALRILTLRDPVQELLFAPRLAMAVPSEPFEPLLRDLLQQLFERALVEERSARKTLTKLYRDLEPPLAVAVIRAGASSAMDDGVGFLSELLGVQPQTDALVLYHMERLVKALPEQRSIGHWARTTGLCATLRRYLSRSDEALIGPAASLVGHFADIESVPILIELLEREKGSFRARAHEALRVITENGLRAEPEKWRRFYNEELTWYRERAAATLRELTSREGHVVAGALLELGGHRLFHDELTESLLGVLEYPEQDLRYLAVAVIAKLGSERAIPRLVEGLEDRNPEFQAACGRALVRITGRELPAESEAWRDLLP